MNANDQFFARDAHVDSAAIEPLPASRKIYVAGSRPDVRVPMREIAQSGDSGKAQRRPEDLTNSRSLASLGMTDHHSHSEDNVLSSEEPAWLQTADDSKRACRFDPIGVTLLAR